MGFSHLNTDSRTAANLPPIPAIPKRSLDAILHYLVMQQLRNKKLPSSNPSFRKPNPYIIFQYYKSFQLVSRLKGAALCLLKTKYAIKPKNPE